MAFTKEGSALVYTFDDETLVIEGWGENSLRVRASKVSPLPRRDWALTEDVPREASVEVNAQGASVTNGKIKALVSEGGALSFFNSEGKLLLREYSRNRRDIFAENCSALQIEARELRPVPGTDDFRLTARFETADNSERVYGMGQYQMPYLNLKGCDLELAQRNSQASVPFFLSSRGYGFLWNNPAVGRAVFGKNITSFEALSTDILDYWITAGDTPSQIEEQYAAVTGTVPMMPDFAMGFWQCKLRYQTQDELLSVAREYKRRGLPISVIVVDFFHWPLEGDWMFDPVYWPDPDAMIRELDEMGITLMVSIWPTVDRRCSRYREMLEKGLLVRSDRGVRVTMGNNTVFFDATNPAARGYVWSVCKKNYYDKGVHIFWLDEAEPEFSTYDFDNYRYYLGPVAKVGNSYPVFYAKAFFDGMKAAGQRNIINLLRCAWAGSQKYGALVWSGDIASTFASFRNQVAAGLNMALAGIPWWTTDIGGFHGGNPDDPAFRELFARWFEYGAFCPVMRLHGDRVPRQKPLGTTGGAACASGGANEVWSFGDEDYEICKKYLALRERLRPYIARQMKAAHEKGTPVMRPLFYDFPDDSTAWECEDAYMFGPDLLVSPVTEAGMRERTVTLPAGEEWTHVWSGSRYKGGGEVTVAAPLDEIPVFTRNEALLPLFRA